jgi:hypothetical protein
VRLGRLGLILNVLAVVWLSFETVNIAWPRTSVAPPGAPWYQVWAGVVVVGAIAFVGLAYLAVARPHDRLTLPVAPGDRSAALDVGHGGRDR